MAKDKKQSHFASAIGQRIRLPTPGQVAVFVLAILLLLRWNGSRDAATSLSAMRQLRNRTAVVFRVIDGDRFDRLPGTRVRLLRVDAPDGGFGESPPEAFATESTAWLRKTIEGKKVVLHIEEPERDRYGRTLAWVYLDDQFINGQLLTSGMARLLPDFGLPANLEPGLRASEAEARVAHRGLWSRSRSR